MDLISPACLHHGERRRAADTATDTDTDTAEEMHKRSAVKRSRRAQTVLGDRHDLIDEILLQELSAACGTRPAEFFNGWARKQICDGSEKRSSENLIRHRGQRNDLSPGKFASRASLRSYLGALRNPPRITSLSKDLPSAWCNKACASWLSFPKQELRLDLRSRTRQPSECFFPCVR